MSVESSTKEHQRVEVASKLASPPVVMPRRVMIGYLLTCVFIVTPLFFSGQYLNSITISMQVCLYLFWASGITLLHKEVRELDGNYQFGPKESMVGAIVPFSYIFWNFHWISVMWKELRLGTFSLKNNNYVVGLIAALASCACYPDNMDKIPHIVPVCGFVILFTITWIFTNRIRSLKTNLI